MIEGAIIGLVIGTIMVVAILACFTITRTMGRREQAGLAHYEQQLLNEVLDRVARERRRRRYPRPTLYLMTNTGILVDRGLPSTVDAEESRHFWQDVLLDEIFICG